MRRLCTERDLRVDDMWWIYRRIGNRGTDDNAGKAASHATSCIVSRHGRSCPTPVEIEPANVRTYLRRETVTAGDRRMWAYPLPSWMHNCTIVLQWRWLTQSSFQLHIFSADSQQGGEFNVSDKAIGSREAE